MEKQILNLFLNNNKLKFNEMEKLLKTRSNKLAYHLKQLTKKEVLTKKKESYFLSKTAENLIPYLSDKKAVLPVILIHVGNKNKTFLYKREKRPFKNYLSLPGGRLLIKESIKQATQRIMQEKFNILIDFKQINSVSLEHVKKQGITHSFLLIFVSAETKENINLINVNKNKSKMIPSDYKLIKNPKNNIEIKTIYSKI
jgi:ADP-ribose pyrophosphatase YjhB (NUDIX family)